MNNTLLSRSWPIVESQSELVVHVAYTSSRLASAMWSSCDRRADITDYRFLHCGLRGRPLWIMAKLQETGTSECEPVQQKHTNKHERRTNSRVRWWPVKWTLFFYDPATFYCFSQEPGYSTPKGPLCQTSSVSPIANLRLFLTEVHIILRCTKQTDV